MKSIDEMEDREILKLLLTNQISLAQQIHRIREVIAKNNKEDYSNSFISKFDVFKELIENSDDFLREFENSQSEE